MEVDEVDWVDYSYDRLEGQVILKMSVGSQIAKRVLRSINEGESLGWLSQGASAGVVSAPCFLKK
jgi:hypothetical protein